MNITVVGAGYVGLVTAACLAEMGHRVGLLEISESRVEMLLRGEVPFFEPDLPELVRTTVEDGCLKPTRSADDALGNTDMVMICVGTPLGADGAADLSQVLAACRVVRDGRVDAPIVVRSTLPLGSTDELTEWLGRADSSAVVTNPEFLRQGTALADFRHPTRIVVGTHDGSSTAAADAVRSLYSPLDAPVIVTDYASAEMIKNVANAFLAMRLSFVNEVADLCEAYGADVEHVLGGIGLDPRIGSAYMRPGIGFGGSCLPKELANLVRLGQKQGLAMPLLDGVGRVNDTRPTRVVDRLEAALGPIRDRRVALLGLAFKPNTDDIRYSPSIALASRLLERGAVVFAHDPVVPVQATAHLPGLQRVPSAEEAILGADLVVLATDWPEYQKLPWRQWAGLPRTPIIFDGRNALAHESLAPAGWQVIPVGRAASSAVAFD